jgi:hypothetical protein
MSAEDLMPRNTRQSDALTVVVLIDKDLVRLMDLAIGLHLPRS